MDEGDGKGRTPAAEPLDLPQIRRWLSSLAVGELDAARSGRSKFFRKPRSKTSSHAEELSAIAENLSGSFNHCSTADVLHRLLAIGTVQYIRAIGQVPVGADASDVVMDVVAFALWSVVQAEALPTDWESVLARLTSPRMADLVAQARDAHAARRTENFTVFVQVLARRPMHGAAHNLLDDLSDPRRGGAALAALALASGLPEPDPRKREKSAATWIFTALLGGALAAEGGNAAAEIDRLTKDTWVWITEVIGPGSRSSHSSNHGDAIADELIHSLFH